MADIWETFRTFTPHTIWNKYRQCWRFLGVVGVIEICWCSVAAAGKMKVWPCRRPDDRQTIKSVEISRVSTSKSVSISQYQYRISEIFAGWCPVTRGVSCSAGSNSGRDSVTVLHHWTWRHMTLSFTVLTSLFSVLSSGKNCYKNKLDLEGRTEQYAMYESLVTWLFSQPRLIWSRQTLNFWKNNSIVIFFLNKNVSVLVGYNQFWRDRKLRSRKSEGWEDVGNNSWSWKIFIKENKNLSLLDGNRLKFFEIISRKQKRRRRCRNSHHYQLSSMSCDTTVHWWWW